MRELDRSLPLTTYLMIAVFAAVFVWQSSLFLRFGEEAGREFILRYSFTETEFLQGEYYRLITSIFLHGGIIHLLSNSAVFFIAGKPLERKTGSFRFTIIFFLSAFAGSLLTALLLDLSGPAVGASGGVMGVLAAASLLVPTDSTLEQIPVLRVFSLPVLRLLFSVSVLGVFFVFQESLMAFFQVYSMVDTTVGHVAHFGGIMAGTVLSYVWYPREAKHSFKFSLVLLVLLSALIIIPQFTRPWYAILGSLLLLLVYWGRNRRKNLE